MARPTQLYPGWRFALRYHLTRWVILVVTRALFRVRVENAKGFLQGPAVVCFNHLNWVDPFIMLTVLPGRPRIHFFGPKEEDMAAGLRNRLMTFSATAVPFRPGKDDLLDTTRRVGLALASGGILAIAGEGRIQPDEHEVLEIQEGTAYFALRNRVPVVPVAISGTSSLSFGGRVRVRVGAPLPATGRPTRDAIAGLSAQVRSALVDLIADAPVPPPSRGRAAWFTELFNDWPEGSRELAEAAAAARRAGPAGLREPLAVPAPEPVPEAGSTPG